MLKTLKDLFDLFQPASSSEPPEAAEHRLQLATAVLLVEVMRSDADLGTAERHAVVDALRSKFALADDEIERLIELAQTTARDAHDYHRFTSTLNEVCDMAQKIRIVEYMWQVAYADGRLDAHEQHVMWRVADLLHVPHGAYVNAKARAREAMGGPPAGPLAGSAAAS